MCFSVEVEKDLKKLSKFFKAQKAEADYHYFENLKARASDLDWLKFQLNLKRKPSSNPFKEADHEGRIFPGTFAPVIVLENGVRVIRPMRYRLRPKGSSEEIPTRFNVFNARFDSLETRPTWNKLLYRQHGLFPFKRFFEWVPHHGKPKLISFNPADREIMWAPCLWDVWESKDQSLSFHSFALITDEPPKEVLDQGHDRCPIFLNESAIEAWLNPASRGRKEIKALLNQKENVVFKHEWDTRKIYI